MRRRRVCWRVGGASVASIASGLVLMAACGRAPLPPGVQGVGGAGGGTAQPALPGDGGTADAGALSEGGADSALDAAAPFGADATPARPPTRPPFSCDPLPGAFVFPAPTRTAAFTASAPGTHARCATFAPGGTSALALSPDGTRAALLNGDGIVRIVELASRQVVAVLAPEHASATRAAFSPSGDDVLTVAGGEHEVTLWRAADATPIWTTTLPGHTYGYEDGAAGAIAFAPDGRSVALSPGTDLYLLDAATGTLRASRPSAALLDVAYAWGGRRLVAADATLSGHCVKRPVGGAIVVLDPDTLATLATPISWAGYSEDVVAPMFAVSPGDDLVLAPPSSRDTDSRVRSFRVSDGSALGRVELEDMPRAFMPDGATLLVAAGGELRLVGVSDGLVVARAPFTPPPPSILSSLPAFAVSADGGTIAVGGDGGGVGAGAGANVLDVWRPGASQVAAVCSLDGPPAVLPLSLSGDGRLAALAVAGGAIRLMRPEDGGVAATITGDGRDVYRMTVSRAGRYVAAQLGSPVDNDLHAWRADDGALVAVLGARNDSGGYWSDLAFAPDERSFYALWQSNGTDPATAVGLLYQIDLGGGALPVTTALPAATSLVGFSGGCPVLFTQPSGIWRLCDRDEEPPVPAAYSPDGPSAVVSDDGRLVATRDPSAATATLWGPWPSPGALRVFGPRSDESGPPLEVPYAVTPGGARVLTGAVPDNLACYAGPGFALRVQDGATGDVLDQLPPAPTSLSEDAARIAYGAQVWCAR